MEDVVLIKRLELSSRDTLQHRSINKPKNLDESESQKINQGLFLFDLNQSRVIKTRRVSKSTSKLFFERDFLQKSTF